MEGQPAELEGLTKRQLKARARELGASDDAIDELDDALELSQWSEPERQRFMDACSSL